MSDAERIERLEKTVRAQAEQIRQLRIAVQGLLRAVELLAPAAEAPKKELN